MYGIAYVIIPTEFASLQTELDEALAPFQRGGPEEFPREKLAFDDVTSDLRRLQHHEITVRWEGARVVLEGANLAISSDLDFDALRDLLQTKEEVEWRGRLAEVEPDFDAFTRRFTTWTRRDPEAGGYGRWLNPLGRWDWWELGGRFDGLVSGEPRRGAGAESMISSGPNRGRDLLGGVVRVFGGKPSEVEAEISSNVDLVSSLLEAARRGDEHAFPTAVVLPSSARPVECRWFDALGWRPIPAESKALLAVRDNADFAETAIAAYERYAEMAVAGVAYHF